MPCIKRLGGIRVCVYFSDENPPHIHVLSAESDAKIRIDTLQIMAGTIKRTEYAKVIEWAASEQESLLEEWRKRNERD